MELCILWVVITGGGLVLLILVRIYNKNIEKNGYNHLEPDEIKASFELQRKYQIWNFYDEREFIENLLQTRFNFLITTYALFLTVLFTTQKSNSKIIITIIGFIILGLMSLTVCRIYVKLIIMLKILRNMGDFHVAPKVDKELNGNKAYAPGSKETVPLNKDGKFKRYKFRLFGVNIIIGIIIPYLIVFSFLVFFVMLKFNIFDLK
jgi:hypothetical protein